MNGFDITTSGDWLLQTDNNNVFDIVPICGATLSNAMIAEKLRHELDMDIMTSQFTSDNIRRVLIRDKINEVFGVVDMDLSQIEFTTNGGFDLGKLCYTTSCELNRNCQ